MHKGLIIIVNYNFAELTIQLIKNLYELNGIENFIVAVADNSENENEISKLEDFKKSLNEPSLQLFKTTGNLGYFGAADFVLNKFAKDRKDLQYVIISNNDIEIRDKDFFLKLFAAGDDAAVIAPDIISTATGKHQNPQHETPLGRGQKFQYRLLYSNYLLGYILHHSRKMLRSFRKKAPGKRILKHEIFASHGAFIILRDIFFKAGGYIDCGCFLFGEEDRIAAQCRDMKLKILFCPELVIFHNEHATTKGQGFRRAIYKLQKNAYRYNKNKYPGFY